MLNINPHRPTVFPWNNFDLMNRHALHFISAIISLFSCGQTCLPPTIACNFTTVCREVYPGIFPSLCLRPSEGDCEGEGEGEGDH